MTKKQVREYHNTHLKLDGERIVDIDIFTNYYTFANIITISRNHVVWKTTYEIVGGELKCLESKCL